MMMMIAPYIIYSILTDYSSTAAWARVRKISKTLNVKRITKDLANILNAHSDTFCLFLQGDQNLIVFITKYQPSCYYSIAA